FREVLTFAIHPNSSLAYYWTFLIVICIVYNCLALAIFIFDDVYNEAFWPWVGINFCTDIIYALDIVVQMKYSELYYSFYVNSVCVVPFFFLAANRIYVDVAAVFPIDILLVAIPYCSLLRTNRLLKIYRAIDFVEMTEQRLTTKNQNISKLLYLVTCCYVIFHWNACIYFFFSLLQGIDNAVPTDFIFGYTKVFDVFISNCGIFMSDIESCIYNETDADNR
ncbi:hypothetical protein PFISCL1PPCAC_14642, partial [Pristionchus fissidentatus]